MNYFLIVLFLVWFRDAYAYLDPGTGSLLIQTIIAFIAGGIFIIKSYWKAIMNRLFSKKKKDDEKEKKTKKKRMTAKNKTSSKQIEILASSFRDPCAQVYLVDNEVYRQINHSAYSDYTQLMRSGLYDTLRARNYLIEHSEASLEFSLNDAAALVLKPQRIPFISYGYEWSFSQFKDAALLTLEIAKISLQHGMILKDASSYNIQFQRGQPILIDTSSFTLYEEGAPWIAYQQFCTHFLAPLALMSKKDVRLGLLMKHYIDGIPLDLASQLLPIKSRLSLSFWAHIHAHAKMIRKFNNTNQSKHTYQYKVSKKGLLGLLYNLSSLIKKLNWSPVETEWSNYYHQIHYSAHARHHKEEIIQLLLEKIKIKSAWDLGANNGYYSRVIANLGIDVVSFDKDYAAVEENYHQIKQKQCISILPLIQDLASPSAAMGWAESERDGLQKRAHADLIVALALIHHLRLANTIPFRRIAAYFSSLGPYLLIEFVPKEDSQIQCLLTSRHDVFTDYDVDHFKQCFAEYYNFLAEVPIKETCRTLFLLQRKAKQHA
ncbi:MAG: SAM-dependent methyltransferase [Legionella sp.]